MKQLALLFSMSLMVVSALSAKGNIPAPPSFGSVNEMMAKKSCQCKVPPFMWNIPTLMADDYRECIKVKFKPSPRKVQVVLATKVDKNAKLVKVEPAKGFFSWDYEVGKECRSSKAGLKNKNIMCQAPMSGLGLYEITYKIGQKVKKMVCDHTLTYCLDKKVIVSDKR